MKISGFSFIRNAVRYDFPIVESLQSLLPLCHQVVVAVGDSDDGTRDLVRAVDPGIQIVDTVWDESLRQGGRILAVQTDIALEHCTGDWCIYLQGDEVLHQDDEQLLRDELLRANDDPRVDGLIFRYRHFYGNYNYIGAGRQWYRREIRAVRNTGRVVSWGDAQGFRQRNPDGSFGKLHARQTDVRVFHYGWVKPPAIQSEKQRGVQRYWHNDQWIEKNSDIEDMFDYNGAYALQPYTGTHPAVMARRIAESAAWAGHFDPQRTKKKPLKMLLSDWIEFRTGYRLGEYRNFITIDD